MGRFPAPRNHLGLAGIRARDWLVPLVSLALAFVLGEAVAEGHPPALDQQLLQWVSGHITGALQNALVMVYRLTGKAFTPVLVLASMVSRRSWPAGRSPAASCCWW